MPQTNKVRAIDTETIGEPSYFNKKDKSKIDHRGHPRGFKAQIVTEADDSQAAIFDPPFGDLKITPPERIVFHNACFDLHVLLTSGLLAMSDIRNLGIEDTRIMLKLLNYDSAALKDAAENILGAKVMRYSEAKNLDEETFRKYAIADAKLTLELFRVLASKIREQGLTELNQIEQEFAKVSFECERNGIEVDTEALLSLKLKQQLEAKILTHSFNDGLKKTVNHRSPRQLMNALALEVQVPVVIEDGRPSTSKRALKKIKNHHPKVNMLLSLKKLESSNRLIEKTLKFVDPGTRRLHPYYDTMGADTGRATSRNPNVQNFPKSEFRKAFRASTNHLIARLDFGQIEPRVLANYIPDTRFAKLFESESDYYELMGEVLFKGFTPTACHRDAAKTFQLSMLYGAGPAALADGIGVSETEAMQIMNRFDIEFPEVPAFRNKTIGFTRQNGYAVGLLGRRRYLPDISSNDRKLRAVAERQAFNATIQGSAATVFKAKSVELRKQLPQDARFLMHIHDELVLEFPQAKAADYLEKAIKVLEGPLSWFSTPLKVEGGLGSNWYAAKKKGDT